MNWPGRLVTSDYKIRAVAIVLFRRWFGRQPTFHWHLDGCMAEASDNRGNFVQIEQFNGYDGWPQDLTRLALPAPEVAQ